MIIGVMVGVMFGMLVAALVPGGLRWWKDLDEAMPLYLSGAAGLALAAAGTERGVFRAGLQRGLGLTVILLAPLAVNGWTLRRIHPLLRFESNPAMMAMGTAELMEIHAMGMAAALGMLATLAAMSFRAGGRRSGAIFGGLAFGAALAALTAVDLAFTANEAAVASWGEVAMGGLGLGEALGAPWLLLGGALGVALARRGSSERLPPMLAAAALIVGVVDGGVLVAGRQLVFGELLPAAPDWKVFDEERAEYRPKRGSDGRVYPELFGAELGDGVLCSPLGQAPLSDADATGALLRRLNDEGYEASMRELPPAPEEELYEQQEPPEWTGPPAPALELDAGPSGTVAVALTAGATAAEVVDLVRAAERAELTHIDLVGLAPDVPSGDSLSARLHVRATHSMLSLLRSLVPDQPEDVYVTVVGDGPMPDAPLDLVVTEVDGSEEGDEYAWLVAIEPDGLSLDSLLERIAVAKEHGASVALVVEAPVPTVTRE